MFKKSTPATGLNKEVKNTTNTSSKKKETIIETIQNMDNVTLPLPPPPPPSSKKVSSKATTYFDFMKSHLYDKNNKDHVITNTRIGDKECGIFGGSYSISDEEYTEFLEKYYNEVFEKKKP